MGPAYADNPYKGSCLLLSELLEGFPHGIGAHAAAAHDQETGEPDGAFSRKETTVENLRPQNLMFEAALC